MEYKQLSLTDFIPTEIKPIQKPVLLREVAEFLGVKLVTISKASKQKNDVRTMYRVMKRNIEEYQAQKTHSLRVAKDCLFSSSYTKNMSNEMKELIWDQFVLKYWR